MACSLEKSLVLEPCSVSFGVFHTRKWTTVADVTSSLNDTYIDLNLPSGDYYVWFNVAAAGTDPAIAGKTAIEVALTANDSAAVVAAAIKTALDAVNSGANWKVDVDGDELCIVNRVIGAITAETDSGSTGFTLDLIKTGLGGDLGKTEGGSEVSFSVDTVEVRADQDGTVLLDEIITATNLEVTMNLLEMTADRWATVVGSVVGDTYTPSGGTEMVGFGTSKVYQNMTNFTGRLVLHPIRKGAELDRDFTLFNTAPMPASINFNNELQTMEVTFKAYKDDSINSAVNIGAFGDSSQILDA